MLEETDIKAALAAQGVKYIFAHYVDIHGVPKGKAVPLDRMDTMASKALFTPGALEGMGDLNPHVDDCSAVPDLERVTVLPWDTRYALVPAELHFHGEPYSHDSRHMLHQQVRAAAEMGFTINVGIEPEFYVLRKGEDGRLQPLVPSDQLNEPTVGYDVECTMLADEFLGRTADYMKELGWRIFAFGHEGGDGQYELDFDYTDALGMADRMVLFRLMIKHVARSLGCVATFMPKPFTEDFGSAGHINISLADRDTGKNLFEVPRDGKSGELGEYSELAYHFTAGVLAHGDALTAVVCPTVNSYKRFIPRAPKSGVPLWAPIYRAHGPNNRTLMCRLPGNRRCLELRVADSICNHYLGIAMTIAAGLNGVREKLDPGPMVDFNTYDHTEEELAELGVPRLPRSLPEALDAFANDDLAQQVFGKEFHETFVNYKRDEYAAYHHSISEWEHRKYLHLL